MLVKVLRKEKLGGIRLVPGSIIDLPDAYASDAIRLGVAQAMLGTQATLHDNLIHTEQDVMIRNEQEDTDS